MDGVKQYPGEGRENDKDERGSEGSSSIMSDKLMTATPWRTEGPRSSSDSVIPDQPALSQSV